MTPFEVERTLKSMTLLVDTREQDTLAFRKRIKEIGLPYERCKLDFGDYSCKCVLPSGETLSLKDQVCIERKMNLNETAACFAKERERFEREFERAKSAQGLLYLLIENGNWEKIFAHEYRSRLDPEALSASLLAWIPRYRYQLIFCEARTTSKLIYKIFRYELKERLKRGNYE